ncbi:hypothetical protein N7475_001054 [Penicillium sp. IBT 31633x]|nr:hypothetical protein N7475_001054 [Penicillium sp. IBT 31633x]
MLTPGGPGRWTLHRKPRAPRPPQPEPRQPSAAPLTPVATETTGQPAPTLRCRPVQAHQAHQPPVRARPGSRRDCPPKPPSPAHWVPTESPPPSSAHDIQANWISPSTLRRGHVARSLASPPSARVYRIN